MPIDASKLYWPPLGKLFDLLNRDGGPEESDKGVPFAHECLLDVQSHLAWLSHEKT